MVETPDGEGVVNEVNLITGQLRVRLDNPTEIGQKYYHRDEVRYLRGGKRKPVPPDAEPEEILQEEPFANAEEVLQYDETVVE